MLLNKVDKILGWGVGDADLFVWRKGGPSNVLGFCERSGASGRYQIHLYLDEIDHFKVDLVEVFAHELIHLDQFLSGRLQYANGIGRFDGVYFDDTVDFLDTIPPYEAEAYDCQNLIRDLLIKDLPNLQTQLKKLAQ